MAAGAHFHMRVVRTGVLVAFHRDLSAGFHDVAAAHGNLLAVQVEQGHVHLRVVDSDGAVTVARTGHLAADHRKQRRARLKLEINALMHAGETDAVRGAADAVAVLAVVQRSLSMVAAVERSAHGICNIQHDRRDGKGAFRILDKILRRNGAVKRGQAPVAVVIRIHILIIGDGAAADSLILVDEPAVLLHHALRQGGFSFLSKRAKGHQQAHKHKRCGKNLLHHVNLRISRYAIVWKMISIYYTRQR